MNCKGVIRELSNYLDGDLDPVVKAELERHLGHCEDCTMIVDQTRKTIEIYSHSKPVELPPEVRGRFHAELKKKMMARPS